MDKTRMITVPVSDGDWNFSFELTLEQALNLLDAQAGETVELNGTRENVFVQDANTLVHTKATKFLPNKVGLTSEGLQRGATLAVLSRMIETDAWSDEDAGN